MAFNENRQIKIRTRFPILFTIGALVFFYIFQYPTLRVLMPEGPKADYPLETWIFALSFALASSVIFIFSLQMGMKEQAFIKKSKSIQIKPGQQKPPLWLVFSIFGIFAAWSFLMVILKIGITIYAEVEQLPFKTVGLLFYGRLFFQPLVLIVIADAYKKTCYRWLNLLLILILGSWSSLSSGSRFIAIMFSLPLLRAVSGRCRWLFWLVGIWLFITIATLSRHFFLPYFLGERFIEIYANDDYQASALESMHLEPLLILLGRSMGIQELMMTLSFGAITPTFQDAVIRFCTAFISAKPGGTGVSAQNIYGFGDEIFGGFGLDFFSNQWILYGGTIPTYSAGLFLAGWLLGKIYRLCARWMICLGLDKQFDRFVFLFLFLLIFEGRIYLLIYILMAALLCQQPICIYLGRLLLRAFGCSSRLRAKGSTFDNSLNER